MNGSLVPLDGILEFIRLLRLAGLRVGLTETQDAVHALSLFPDWTHARAVLKAALLKRNADGVVFDRAFELFFHRAIYPASTGEGANPRTAAQGGGQSQGQGAGVSQGVAMPEAYGQALDRAVQFMLRHVFIPARDERARGEHVRGDQARGERARDVQEALILLTQMVQAQAPTDKAGEAVRRDLELAFLSALQADQTQALEALLARAQLDQVDFSHMDASEAQLIEEQVEQWVRQLLARARRRHEPARRGRLELRKTVRRCLQYGGVPLKLVRKRRRIREPRLFVLADVSRSVQAFARFFLMLTRAFQGVAGPCRSFAFSDGLYEITEPLQAELARRARPAEAVDRLLGQLRAAGLTQRHTDYGTTLGQFRSAVRRLDRRSTVIILGDARSNQAPARTQALREVYDRVRQVLWLNPERRVLWNTGDSIMQVYEPYCSRVWECRNLAHLRTVVLTLAGKVGEHGW